MTHVFARKALLHKGWSDNVRFVIRDGRIDSVDDDAIARPDDVVTGIVIPGLTNAHSHAFQRALAGRTERRSPTGKDNFWTWRERMYELAGQLDPGSLQTIARQAYSEMLASGYTTVAEFHYMHTGPGGGPADDAMMNAVLAAATHSGSYIPVLYERAGFDAPEPEGHQARFALDVESFLAHHTRTSAKTSDMVSVGIGAHSLRAVHSESLTQIEAVAASRGIPLHLHIAEQQREVDQCLAAYGRRPVRWLLENFEVDNKWCLVHATHMDYDETESLAKTGAVVCLCPSTEANLGDGLFPLHDFLSANGTIAIGSDSHVSINPFEELRWLEYGQRLASRSRNVASLQEAHVGRELFLRALAGGAQVSTQEPAGLQPGAYADLVTLDDDDPMLVGHDDASLLDALVFSGYRLPIDRVMVHGQWRVIEGIHVDHAETRSEFAATLESIGASR
jgi:formimidoylglutamate deiminase